MQNQQEIFLELIQVNRGIIIKIIRIYMDAEEDRQDLEQEIIYQLWKSYAKFNGDSKFSTWMYRVALNTAITFFKKDKKRVDKTTVLEGVDVRADEIDNTKEGQLKHFYIAVKKLNKVEKAIILMFIEGLSHKDISENLGLSEVNTRVKLNRTKKKIQQLIKNQGYEF